ncbi:MAG: hypothetical protein ACK4Z0_05755 [Sphingomonadaceae bacterium]
MRAAGPPGPPIDPELPAGAPTILSAGAIFGTLADGQTIVGDEAVADGDPEPTIAYRWRLLDPDNLAAPGTLIESETGLSLVWQAVWDGFAVVREAVATNSSGTAIGASNVLLPPVPAFAFAGPSIISGAYGAGEVVGGAAPTTVNGTAPVTLSYQWQSRIGPAWSDIAGATSLTYTRSAGLANAGLRRRDTATDAASQTITQISNEIAEFIPANLPTNTTAPAFIQPDGSGGWEAAEPIVGRDIYLDVGVWSGGYTPYFFEVEIRRSSNDAVLVARSSELQLDLSALVGETVYARVYCVDDANQEASANTAAFGPIVSGFVPQMVAYTVFRSTGSRPGMPAAAQVVNGNGVDGQQIAAFAGVSGSSFSYANSGSRGSPTLNDRENATGGPSGFPLVAGSMSIGNASTSGYAYDLPAGWYEMQAAFGHAASTNSINIDMRTGTVVDGGGRIRSFATSKGSHEMLFVGGAASADENNAVGGELLGYSAISENLLNGSGGWYRFYTPGGVVFDRLSNASAHIACIKIRTAEAP